MAVVLKNDRVYDDMGEGQGECRTVVDSTGNEAGN